jgi:hypothetical protein
MDDETKLNGMFICDYAGERPGRITGQLSPEYVLVQFSETDHHGAIVLHIQELAKSFVLFPTNQTFAKGRKELLDKHAARARSKPTWGDNAGMGPRPPAPSPEEPIRRGAGWPFGKRG